MVVEFDWLGVLCRYAGGGVSGMGHLGVSARDQY